LTNTLSIFSTVSLQQCSDELLVSGTRPFYILPSTEEVISLCLLSSLAAINVLCYDGLHPQMGGQSLPTLTVGVRDALQVDVTDSLVAIFFSEPMLLNQLLKATAVIHGAHTQYLAQYSVVLVCFARSCDVHASQL